MSNSDPAIDDTDIDDAANINSVHNSDSDTSNESYNLICKDIDDIINSCHELHANIIVANDLLSNITNNINRYKPISIEYDGITMEFYKLIGILHTEALKNIEAGRQSNFDDLLINAINKSVFHTNL